MKVAILLLETAYGTPTEFDGKYVAAYDPSYVTPDGSYDGGILEVTDDLAAAMAFPTLTAAYAKYRESYGIRPDGEPNRPLTAWSVTFEQIPEAL